MVTGTITLGQSGPESNGNEGILQFQISTTEVLPSDAV